MLLGEEVFDGGSALYNIIVDFVPDLLLLLNFELSVLRDHFTVFLADEEGVVLELLDFAGFLQCHQTHLPLVVLLLP